MCTLLTTVAIVYDFDGTLAIGNIQENSFIPKLKLTKEDFWKEVKKLAKKNEMDEVLAYMYLLLKKAKSGEVKIDKKSIKEHGKSVKYFKGTSIAKEFKNIFASSFMYDQHGVAEWPAIAINYTGKTQYLFRINKGISNAWDNTKINKYMPENPRPIPFSHIIYLGDGETDIPAMKMVNYKGGFSIIVYPPNDCDAKKKAKRLLKEDRAAYAALADYSKGKEIDQILIGIINKIAEGEILKKYSKA